MSPHSNRPALVALAAALLVAAAWGCGGGGARFAAPPQSVLPGGVSVTFQRAEADGNSLTVKFYFMNLSDQIMFVNRDGFGLRLPTGEVLQRRGFNQEPYKLAPGEGHNVWVKFEERSFEPAKLAAASVVIGGISYSNDPMPRTVGEIPISNAGARD
jgi:hypothetical protein